VGDRERGADPARRRGQGGDRPLRADAREHPPGDRRERRLRDPDRRPPPPAASSSTPGTVSGRTRRSPPSKRRTLIRAASLIRRSRTSISPRASRWDTSRRAAIASPSETYRSRRTTPTRWVVVARSIRPRASWASSQSHWQLAILFAVLALFPLALLNWLRAQRVLTEAAETDPLTGLGNSAEPDLDARRATPRRRARAARCCSRSTT
jgi:hypothetical protein